jgi:hypothetical protein
LTFLWVKLNVLQLPRAFGEELKPKPTEGTINYFAPRDWTSRFASFFNNPPTSKINGFEGRVVSGFIIAVLRIHIY